MTAKKKIDQEFKEHPDLMRMAENGRKLLRGLTQTLGSEALTRESPHITVATIGDVYRGQAVSVTSERIVLATDSGVVQVPMNEIVVITP